MTKRNSPLEYRFWLHVHVAGPDDCWEWTGSLRAPANYGQIALTATQKEYAHRVSYKLAYGDPGDLLVCHKCDNPKCVNPAHLFLGTYSDNMRDMVAKGRNSYGPNRPGLRKSPLVAPVPVPTKEPATETSHN